MGVGGGAEVLMSPGPGRPCFCGMGAGFAGVKQGWPNSQRRNVNSMFLNQFTCL